MKKKLAPMWICLPVLIAACAQSATKPQLDAGKAAIDRALAAAPAAAEPAAVEQALLPPLVVEMPRVNGKPSEPRFDLAVNNAPA